MSIIKAFVIPHGDNILNPSEQPIEYREQEQQLHDSMVELVKEFDEIQPDLVFLITPHGHALQKSHCIYLNQFGYGQVNPPPDQSESEYAQKIDIDSEISKGMLDYLQQFKQIDIQGMTSFGDTLDIPLAWGEIVPIWFLRKYSNFKNYKFIILSISNRRKTEADKMAEELTFLGSRIYNYLTMATLTKKKKIVLINSCDLAHTHEIKDGPDKGKEPYGISPTAEPFDQAIQYWALNPLKYLGQQALLQTARQLIMKALSCGFCGLVVFASIMKSFELIGMDGENDNNLALSQNQQQEQQQFQEQSDIDENFQIVSLNNLEQLKNQKENNEQYIQQIQESVEKEEQISGDQNKLTVQNDINKNSNNNNNQNFNKNIFGREIISKVYCINHPTYFGMMVASFEFKKKFIQNQI